MTDSRRRRSDVRTGAGPGPAAVHADVDLVLATTRSVRRRMDLDRPVAREVIEACLELALQAPSGANRQDWEFIAVDDPAVREGVAGIYRAAFENHYGTRTEPSEAGERLPGGVRESAHRLAETMHRVPVLVIPVRHSVPPTERAGQASWWASILPAAWSFMLAARSRGLVTSYTARGCDREAELAEVLGLEYPGVTQAGIIAVGHPDHQAFKVARRRPPGEVMRWNREQTPTGPE